MPVPKDELVLQADGYVTEDPSVQIREAALQLIASRKWTTPSIFFGDQPEPDEGLPAQWSITFNLGLDGLKDTRESWYSDAEAIIDFVTDLSKRLGTEFILEIRSTSRLWWSLTVAIIQGEKPDMSAVCTIVEKVALAAPGS
jgi:hypothetical protein